MTHNFRKYEYEYFKTVLEYTSIRVPRTSATGLQYTSSTFFTRAFIMSIGGHVEKCGFHINPYMLHCIIVRATYFFSSSGSTVSSMISSTAGFCL